MTLPQVDRAAALAEGAPRIPRRVIVTALLIAAALALGGTLLERIASGVGLNPTAAPTTTTTSPTNAELHSSTASLLGIASLTPALASGFTLTDQAGRTVALRSLRGDVVVVSFFNADCADACPVIAADIRLADADLGARRGDVVFLTINTDPLATGSIPRPRAVTSTGLSRLANWYYLTGSLRTLDPIWQRYGVAIDVYTRTGVVAHNDVMYFIDRTGRLRTRATPVANEARSGVFSLPRVLVARSAAGIASYAASLLGSHT
jgi:cytochrome oxidase Cu insertion factor (SCO1/SenC/PrrC family)